VKDVKQRTMYESTCQKRKWNENGVLQVRTQTHIFIKEAPLLQAHGSFRKIGI